MKSPKQVNPAGIIAERCGPGVLAQIGHLRDLQAKQAQALNDLERSMALEALWPNVFDGPRGVSSSWQGKPSHRITNKEGYVIGPQMYYDLYLCVTNARGYTKSFPQDEVPPLLWPNPTKGVL